MSTAYEQASYHENKRMRERTVIGTCLLCGNPRFEKLPETLDEYNAANTVIDWCPSCKYKITAPK